jgi:PncC family amidohydrolase
VTEAGPELNLNLELQPEAQLELTASAERLQSACVAAGLTVSTAESCTGGLVAHLLTEIPGSSEYFLGGVVAYADRTKQGALDVPAELIARHGAVSAQVARAMAEGARRRIGSDLAVSVTGIAGPGGGTDSKPVGLTYIAVDGPGGCEVRRFVWPHDRSGNKRASAGAAIGLLIACALRATAAAPRS